MNRLGSLMVLMVLVVGMAHLGAAETIFYDGFEDGDYTSSPGWTVTGGSWNSTTSRSSSGSYSIQAQSSGSYDYIESTFGFGSGFQSYQADVYTSDGNNRIYFRLNDPNNGALSNPDLNSYSSFTTGTWHNVKVKVDISQETYDVIIDGSTVASNQNFINSYSGGDLQYKIVTTEKPYLDDFKYTANSKPQFNSSNISPDPPLIGENISYSAEVYDPDGSIDYTNLTLEYGGSTVVSDTQRTGTTSPSWNDVYVPSGGDKWLNATLEVVDDAGAVTTQELNRQLTDDAPQFTINDPTNTTYTTPDIPYEIYFQDDGDSNPNETGYCEVYNDGSLVTNESVSEASPGTFSGTVNDVPAGSHTFETTCYEDNDGQSTTQSVQYSNENGAPSIDSFTSTPTSNWQKNDQIDFSYSISDGFDNITYVNLTAKRDGTTIANQEVNYNTDPVSDTVNNFFEVTQIGNYSVELTAQDEQAQVSREWINQSAPDEYPPTTTTNLTTNTFYESPVYVGLNATDDESMIANLSYSVDGASYTTVQSSTATVNISGFGDHTLDFYAWDNAGNKEAVNSEIISLEALEAGFFFNPTEPYTGETVTFDAGTTQGNITQYEWDFQSDGTYDSTGEIVNHVYNDPGVKDVTLRVTDNDGNTDTETQSLEVLYESENKSLVNTCPDSPFCRTNGSNPNQISGSLTAEDGNQTFTYEVNATGADGTYDFFSFYNSTSSRLSTTSYSQILNVTIASNETNIPPSADFTVSFSGLTVDTDASSSSDQDGTITDYRWDWTNDGTYEDTGLTASHTYPSNGDYTIKLQVEDNNESTSSITKTVSVSESTDGGGTGGGGTGGDGTTDNETTVSVDGSTATLLAPNEGARYSKSTFTVAEGGSNTISINGNEHTLAVDDVKSSSEAQVVLDGTTRSWFEGEIETIKGLEVRVVDVVQKGSGGKVSFTISDAVDLNEPVAWYAYNYTINNSGSVELQLREAGIGNSWSTIDSNTVSNTVDNQYVNFTQSIDSGIYEARLRLNASGNSSISNVNGFYAGEVPRLDIVNPTENEQVKAPRTPTKNIPLDYIYELREWSNVTDSGQLYIDDQGNKYSVLVDRSVDTTDQDTWFESLTKLVTGLSVDQIYSSGFSWFYPTEPDLYNVNTTMQVNGGFGDYTGYVNVTVNDSTGSEKTVYSYGRNIEIVPQSTTEYIKDNKDSEVVNTGERTFNQSFGDVDGDGEDDTVGTLVTALDTPQDDSTVTVSSMADGNIEFHFFAMNVNGTALLNKSLKLEDVDKNETVKTVRLTPGKNEYRINLNGTEVGEWNMSRYRYSVEYFEPGTNDTSLYNSTQDGISNTFQVKRAGLKDLASRIIDPLIDAFTSIYDVTSDYAGFIMALVATIGWYVASKVRGLDFLAKAGAVTIFAVAWWYGLIPGWAQAIVIGFLALTIVIKLLRGEITL